jgi:hypothetical protein
MEVPAEVKQKIEDRVKRLSVKEQFHSRSKEGSGADCQSREVARSIS